MAQSRYYIRLTIAYLSLLLSGALPAQAQEETTVLDSAAQRGFITVIAGEYGRNKLHSRFLGRHYRTEWTTPVRVPLLLLDTVAGGLRPLKAESDYRSRSIELHNPAGRAYQLRSLDKSFAYALPPEFQNTFVEDLINDQVTIGHPYTAFTIPPMATAAGILHTRPRLGYVPKQPALDTFNEDYGNRLYLLEQYPHTGWAPPASNLGPVSYIISTDSLFEHLSRNPAHRLDQKLYVRSRLFDMLIGDWSRNESHWLWAAFEQDGQTIIRPIPRDRDQAYTIFDGYLPKLILHTANLDKLQSFDYKIDEVKPYNTAARHLDRRAANEMTGAEWVEIARSLQRSLTDEVIETAIRQMPPEVFEISGPGIIERLKSRRDQLQQYAAEYYRFLARHVDVVGSTGNDYFIVNRQPDGKTEVTLYAVDTAGRRSESPLYRRMFLPDETRDVRIYGLNGRDRYRLQGTGPGRILMRIVGGPGRDSIIDKSSLTGGRKARIYDNRDNDLLTGPGSRLRLGHDSAIHAYDYHEFDYHRRGLRASAFYNNPDRFYLGVGYGFKRHRWRKEPYGFEQAIYLRYSLSQNAFSLTYTGRFNQLFGAWNLDITGNLDAIRWTNFYGLGNETPNTNPDRRYYQLRTRELMGSATLNRLIGRHHLLELTGFFQGIQVVHDPGRFVSEHFTPFELYYHKHHQYAGGRLGYTFQHVNDQVLPTRGLMLYAGAAYTQNIRLREKGFATYNGIAQFYVPLYRKFSLSVRAGLSSVHGEPEFFQYASLGGSQNLRGFRRDRFWGQTAFYNTNELRWITDIRSYIMNGKGGFLLLFDNGRVWMPGENSDVWRTAFGGGILLSPFNRVTASGTIAVSNEGPRVHLRLNRLLD
jgi:hypothetical protein